MAIPGQNHIQAVYNAGDDALGYEFEITVGSIASLVGLVDLTGLTLRTNTINIPSQERGEYTYDYKTRTVLKPNGKVTTPTEFDFEFRTDKNYVYYKLFSAWQNLIANDSGASRDALPGGISPIRTTMTVKTIDANGLPTGQVWEFQGCWCKSLGSITLDNQSGDPIQCSVTFGFLSMVAY